MRHVGLFLIVLILASACARVAPPEEVAADETVEWVVINNYSGSGAE